MKTKIKFKSVLQGIRSIKKKNEMFNSLSDEDKRKEIAWDSLKLILSEKMKGSDGSYWGYDLLNTARECKDSKVLCKTLQKVESCEVCARGAVMLSQIRLGNSVSPFDYCIADGNKTILKGFKWFSFLAMEEEYEYNCYYHPYFTRTTEKLANILCNVIENGFFNIQDQTNYLYDISN